VQAEGIGGVQMNVKILILIKHSGRRTGKLRVTYNIDRQRQAEWEGTKYTEESN